MARKRNNNNRNKSGNKSATKSTIVKGQPVRKSNAKNLNRLLEGVCSVTDPFCPAAASAKWTSVGTTHTITQRVMFERTMASDPSKHTCMVFMPTIDTCCYVTSYGTTIPALTHLNGTCGVYTSMCANFKQARIVSAGLTWFNKSSDNNLGGSVYVHEIEDYLAFDAVSNTLPVNDFGYFANEAIYDRRQAGSWVSRPTRDDSYDFATPTIGYSGSAAKYNRTGLYIGCNGSASTDLVTVHFYINYEFTFDMADLFGGRLSIPKPIKDETVMITQVATDVDSILPSFFRKAGDKVSAEVKKFALKALDNMAANTVTAIAAYVGGPAGGFAARAIMDVD